MRETTKEEQLKVTGGLGVAAGLVIAFIVGTLFSFIIGVIDGSSRPLPCRK